MCIRDRYQRRVRGRMSSCMDVVFGARWEKMAVYVEASGQDLYAFQHPNGLCVIGFTASHPACSAKDLTVSYDVGGSNLQDTKVSGKRKRGAAQLKKGGVLCTVQAGGAEYDVRSPVVGDLMELNDRLSKEPELLSLKPESSGFVAIIRLHPKHLDALDKMVSWKDYKAVSYTHLTLPTKRIV
eukprot:TRINITY_DN8291_c0_g1_i3.p1 TRINITY_DN8291_c0_g1~~TRINITY_DN8291_c0_g1_i3.p1  ORF type:complete len:183 (-),score=49.04 TRINITY_DN8291_c0_g1_i3:81-629(-)